MSNKIMDIHNHTKWSDGASTVEEIIENAINNKVNIIGISDHFNTIKCNSVLTAKLEQYIQDLEKEKEKYKDKIEVLAGIEICMNKDWCELDKLPYDKLNKLDYVLFEYIDWFPSSVTLKEIKNYASKITCKKGLAHTDIFSLIKIYGIGNVIEFIKENELFWEINVNRGYGYFDYILMNNDKPQVIEIFNKLKKNNIKITVGSDTHSLWYYDINRIIIGNQLASTYDVTSINIG